jgi:hypothetical protein
MAASRFKRGWFILGPARLKLVGCVDDEHLLLPVFLLTLPEDQDAGGEAGPRMVKKPKPPWSE